MVLIVDRQVIESLSRWTRQFDLGDSFQRGTRSLGGDAAEEQGDHSSFHQRPHATQSVHPGQEQSVRTLMSRVSDTRWMHDRRAASVVIADALLALADDFVDDVFHMLDDFASCRNEKSAGVLQSVVPVDMNDCRGLQIVRSVEESRGRLSANDSESGHAQHTHDGRHKYNRVRRLSAGHYTPPWRT